MKKLLMKIILIATAVLAWHGGIPPALANAEETQESIVESVESVEMENVSTEQETIEIQPNIADETDGSKWFDETIKPMIIEYGASVVAFVTAVWILLKDFNKIKRTLVMALGALTKSNDDNISTSQAVAKFKEEFQAEYKLQKEENDKRMAEMADMLTKALSELQKNLADEVKDIDETAHKLLNMEMIAYGDNAQLVSNGTAKRIAEVVKHGKAKDKK